MVVTVAIAILLHGGFMFLFSLPASKVLPDRIKQPVRINLLATIAETNANTASEMTKPVPPILKKLEPLIQKAPIQLPMKPEQKLKLKPKPKPIEPRVAKKRPAEEIPKKHTLVETVAPVEPVKSSNEAMSVVSMTRYEQQLVAWLERHKKYPSRAKRMRIEGEVLLRIIIDRLGEIQQISLAKRSGNRLLDKSAIAMAQRANPFPPMLENDLRAQLEFVVPVDFSLR